MAESRWYVVHVAAGSESQVVSEIKRKFEKEGTGHLLEELLVFTKESSAMRRGNRVKVQERVFPGYVFVRMAYCLQSFSLIKGVAKVSGFLGSDSVGNPRPLQDEEVQRLIGQVERIAESFRIPDHFEVGQVVRVCDGLFTAMEGIVENVDVQKKRLKVSIDILGRSTPVELEFSQVE